MRGAKTVLSLLVGALTLFCAEWCMGEEIKVGAGAAPTENILKPIKEAFEKATGYRLTILASGPKVALQDLQAGALDAAAAGLEMGDWLALMKKEGAEVRDAAALQAVEVGRDRIVVLTHKSNPVSKLSKDQLKGIFTGKTASWKEVGGADLPIIVVWGTLIPGTNAMFAKATLDGEAVTKEVLEANTAEDVRQNVAANPEAVGIGPVAVINETVRSPETPEIGRPINFVTIGKPSPKVQKLIDFVRGEGQKLVKK